MLSLVPVGLFLATAPAAGAQESEVYVTEPPPEVLTEIELPPEEPMPAPAAEVRGAEARAAEDAEVAGVQARAEGLAFTGGDAAGLALIGGVAVAGGAGLLAVRRRSASA